MALIDRGNCSWSEKVSMATNLSASNNINLTAILITDNETHPDADYELRTLHTIDQGIHYSSPLPMERNVSSMQDNDLQQESLSMPVYFGPYKYGADMHESILSINNNMNDSIRVFWNVAAYLTPFTVQEHTGPIFSRGYLSYIIALAAVFLVGKRHIIDHSWNVYSSHISLVCRCYLFTVVAYTTIT